MNDEHVIPRNLYPHSKLKPGLQLLTVRAHRVCNSAYSSDEEHFRNFIVTAGEVTPATREIFFGPMVRSFNHRGGQGKFWRFGRLIKQIENNEKIETRIYPDERVHRVVRKIVRGLAYYHFGDFVPEAAVLSESKYILPNELREDLTWEERADEIFRYGYAWINDNELHSGWVLTFYQNREFIGIVRK